MAKRKNSFKKSILIYTGIAFILCMVFTVYIYFTLISYEANQTGNFLATTIKKLDDNTLKGYLKENNKNESLLNDYKKIIKSNDVKYAKIADNTFEARINGRLLFTIDTKVVANKTKLAVFSYEVREATKITPSLDRGFIYYDVTIPSNYKILIDGKAYDKEPLKEEEYEDLDFMYYNKSMPKLATYEINDLDSEKNIVVKDFLDNEIKLNKEDYKYETKDLGLKVGSYDNLKEKIPDAINVTEVAHNWSLFMTKDLSGSYYGLNKISTYLISGTSLYQMASSWAHSIDITFTSKHTLKDPIFTDEVLDNCILYSDNAFSCDIRFTKNMVVNGKDQPDKMHDTMYFIKDNDNTWKLINIKSIEDNNE